MFAKAFLALIGAASAIVMGVSGVEAQTVTRGPYLQQTTESSTILRWRTDVATSSGVKYGAAPGSLINSAGSVTATTEHEVQLSGLGPETRYYYSVGTSSTVLAGDDSNHFFTTSPIPGTAVPTRIWVLGDSGTADGNARAVRDAYLGRYSPADTDLWLMLGDNAYTTGTDPEYQAAVFDTYPDMLRNVALWPTLGNHDGASTDPITETGPYYQIFSLPKAGEAGGVASGVEGYYSFDYGNIHFISLESFETDRSAGGAMMTWLGMDLAATDKDWIIAFWHHPPYSKGSHDSDSDGRMSDMRAIALPILEAYGVDLVLGGHSHAYERSKFIDGHYGKSSTWSSSMALDSSSGRDADLGPYEKAPGAAHSGAVYAVAGSSGKIGGGTLDHPAMYVSMAVLGSMVLEVNGNRLDATFLNSTGAELDTFSIVKGLDETPPVLDRADALDATTVEVAFAEAVDAVTAETPGNYSLSGGATVSDATAQADPKLVRLTTSALTEGLAYTLGVANVEDLAGNQIAAGAETTFTYTALHSLSFQDALAPDASYLGTRDVTLSQNAPTNNLGADATLMVDGDDPSGTGNDLVALMSWDVSDIPANATVEGATITINVTNVSGGSYALYALLAPWQEGTATWSQRSSGAPWGAPGASGAGDRGGAVLGYASGGAIGPHSIALNADGLDLVQSWVEGGANNGVILADGAVTDGLDFSSREDAGPVNRPKLTVTYTLPSGGGDTIAPLPPTDLAVSAVGQTSVSLFWSPCENYPTPCDNVGVTEYSVYRDGNLVGTSATPDFTDTGLSPGVAYDYDVASHDAAGNISPFSAVLTVTTDPAPVASMVVNDVNMVLATVGKKKHQAVATVVIHDGDAIPVVGASVTGVWSGLVGGTATATTGAGGIATFSSGPVNTNVTGQFVFAVSNVTLAGYDYDPDANVEDADCIDSDGQQCSGDPGNQPPTASFTAPTSCVVGADCNFTDTSSDGDGSITGWSWNFGDNGDSDLQNPNHPYDCPAGVYAVSLTVTDNGGASDTANANVTVTGDCEPAPVVLSEVSSVNNGGTWVAAVRITVASGGAVGGTWSGGVSATGGCDATVGPCNVVSPDIRKKEGSVTYTAETLDGELIAPPVSLTVLKP